MIASVAETLLPSVAVFLRGHPKLGRYLFWFFRSEEVVKTVCCDSDGFPELLSVFCGVFFVWVVRFLFAFQVLRFPYSFPLLFDAFLQGTISVLWLVFWEGASGLRLPPSHWRLFIAVWRLLGVSVGKQGI